MMNRTWKSAVAAFLTASIITFVGIVFFFAPIADSDPVPAAAPVPAPVGFFIYVALAVALYDWLANQMNSAAKAAFGLAAAQFVLVIDFTLRGERGLVTLVASGILLAVTWSCVAFVYSKFSPGRGAVADSRVN
jgi:hypothetical protein